MSAESISADSLDEYAQRVVSSEGKHDGLYWQSPERIEESPLGPFVAAAEAQGYGKPGARGQAPYQGYHYRILTRQGRNASGGVQNYLVNGHLTGGFALVAFPAKYGDSGVMTVVVNQDGHRVRKESRPGHAHHRAPPDAI